MTVENLIETYGIVIIIFLLIKMIYSIVLIVNIRSSADDNFKTAKHLENIETKQNEILQKLERIAKALESNDDEPYIIEKEDV